MQARKTPETHADLVEYFLATEGGEMQYEVARRRPLITPEFFSFLAAEIGEFPTAQVFLARQACWHIASILWLLSSDVQR